MKLTIYTDGASRGNPGPASYGFTVSDESGNLLYEKGKFIGVTTNNVAEYTGALEALKFARKEYGQDNLEIKFYADSRLVIEQLSGRFKVKSAHLKPIINQIKELSSSISKITYFHIPRSQNSQADKLANLALDRR